MYMYVYIYIYMCVCVSSYFTMAVGLPLYQDFIQAMLPHHQGAVDMCAVVLTSSTDSWPSCTKTVSPC